MPSAPTPLVALGGGTLGFLLRILLAGVLLAGVIVVVARRVVTTTDDEPPIAVVRSWIAISLVFALIVFCAAALRLDDEQLRSTLFGGLVASVGAAVAFYFSSRTADQARADIRATTLALAHGTAKPTAFSEASPPGGKVGELYTFGFEANGEPPPTYELLSGQLPAGLTLDADGSLHGTPTRDGAFSFAVRARNAGGALAGEPVTLTIAP